MKNAEMPAWPHLMKVGEVAKSEGGLTKREHFAAMAMQGLLANPGESEQEMEHIAALAVHGADLLLAELEKTP